jgi:hypothetical protein
MFACLPNCRLLVALLLFCLLFAFCLLFRHDLGQMSNGHPTKTAAQKQLPYEKLPDEAATSPCLVFYLSQTQSELLSYDYFIGGSRLGQEVELRFSSATAGLRFGETHDPQQILEWVGGKKVYSFTALPGECTIEVVKASDEEE